MIRDGMVTTPTLGSTTLSPSRFLGQQSSWSLWIFWDLLFLGDCKFQQKLFPCLEHTQGLSPMRILWHFITCEVTHQPFSCWECLQGFPPPPGFRSSQTVGALTATLLKPGCLRLFVGNAWLHMHGIITYYSFLSFC